MIRKPPAHVYSDEVVLRVCTGVDRWQVPSWRNYHLSHVCLQSSSETRRTATNTEVSFRSIMFYDSLYSSPKIDLEALKAESEGNGHQMQIEHRGTDYTVYLVDNLSDEFGRFDHSEVGLI